MSDLSCWQHRRQIREALLLRKGVWSLAACHSGDSKQARLVERKVCFISDIRNCGWVRGGEWTSVQRLIPPHRQPVRQELFIDRSRRIQAETPQSSLTVIFKLVIGGLTSVILIVLGTVSLYFQGPFVHISLKPILGIMAAYVMDTV